MFSKIVFSQDKRNNMSIEVRNLYKYYGEQAAVKNVSFKVNTGEIVGFLGPNGAGKSTTMKIITGYIPASKGEALVCDIPVSVDSLETKALIGYLPEHNPLYLDMYVREYLEFIAKIYNMSDIKDRVSDMVKRVGLEIEQNKKIGALSKGYRQRVGLAQAIIHEPKVLILDEPTSGLDPNQLVEIRELIKNVGKEKTVMLSTHIMQEVEAICDRVIIINRGEIVADDQANIIGLDKSIQTVYVEFDAKVSKTQLRQMAEVQKIEPLNDGWLLESDTKDDLRKIIASFAQNNELLILTLKKEEKSLEEVFKTLTQK